MYKTIKITLGFEKYIHKIIFSFLFFQIDLDVNRTYRDHIMFRERYNPRQQALFHVLAAYSVYNTEIGYCQGKIS